MPLISPFRAVRYNTDRYTKDLSKVIAPPYDVLDGDGKAALLHQDERNIVAVDLPHVPPKAAGPDEVYVKAAAVLARWRSEQTLVADVQPNLYVYHQEYTHAGRSFVRRMFFARMRLEPFGTGTVFPHEQTFGGPKEDRLKLMQTTRCQLSAVFGLYSDSENSVSGLLNAVKRPPDVTATLDGVINRLWLVQDAATIEAACDKLAKRPVYIADGHHRYSTALMYRDNLIRERESLPEDHPAQYVLVGFCAMEDPGCVILPTHRVLSGFGAKRPGEILDSLQSGLKTKTANPNVTDPDKLLPADSQDDLGVYLAAGDRMYTGTFTQREILASLAADRSAAWRKLDLAYLHRYLIDELVTKGALGGSAPTVQYTHSAPEAVQTARAVNGLAIICKPCTMAQLKAVSDANDLMPQKSTFFYPKLATGLVINPLE